MSAIDEYLCAKFEALDTSSTPSLAMPRFTVLIVQTDSVYSSNCCCRPKALRVPSDATGDTLEVETPEELTHTYIRESKTLFQVLIRTALDLSGRIKVRCISRGLPGRELNILPNSTLKSLDLCPGDILRVEAEGRPDLDAASPPEVNCPKEKATSKPPNKRGARGKKPEPVRNIVIGLRTDDIGQFRVTIPSNANGTELMVRI